MAGQTGRDGVPPPSEAGDETPALSECRSFETSPISKKDGAQPNCLAIILQHLAPSNVKWGKSSQFALA